MRQQADQPVDWYEWGEEALARSRNEDRPLLLSVGYASCHWCHVMAHETFADATIAAAMNAAFVNVKVDREERPDIDAVYMDALQAMTGRGGWPMTLFLTPAGEPFYGGTYFPPAARHGLPGFASVVESVARAWRDRREAIGDLAGRLAEALQASESWSGSPDPIRLAPVEAAARAFLAAADRAHGGFGGAPKFPQVTGLQFLLGRCARTEAPELWDVLSTTLGAMARGALCDQLTGGFHRYCVDAEWRRPHFEKMLGDNAMLARLYLCAWQLTGSEAYRSVADATLAYVVNELSHPTGGFCSAQDADTVDGEGAYYTWSAAELGRLMDERTAAAARAWFGLEEPDEREPAALRAPLAPEMVSRRLALSVAELVSLVSVARERMMAARRARAAPTTDRKRIVSWNALAIDALATCGVAMGRPAYLGAAERAAQLLLASARCPDGLRHVWQEAGRAAPAFQEDYASLAGACVTLYESTFEVAWLHRARDLAEEMIELFWDEGRGGFHRTGPRHERLLTRQKEFLDSPLPSGNALAAGLLQRLASFDRRSDYEERLVALLSQALPLVRSAPTACGAMLSVLDNQASGRCEVVIAGPPGEPLVQEMLARLRARFVPGMVYAAPGTASATEVDIPMLAGRGTVRGRPAAWVCLGRSCRPPAMSAGELVAQLDEATASTSGG